MLTYEEPSIAAGGEYSYSWAELCREFETEIVVVVPSGYSCGGAVLRAVEQLHSNRSLGAILIESETPSLIARRRYLADDAVTVQSGRALALQGYSGIQSSRRTGAVLLVERYLEQRKPQAKSLSTSAEDLGVVRLTYSSFKMGSESRRQWLDANHRGEIEFLACGVRHECDPQHTLTELIHRLERCSAYAVLVTADCFKYTEGFMSEASSYLRTSGATGIIDSACVSLAVGSEIVPRHPELLFGSAMFQRTWLIAQLESLKAIRSNLLLFEKIVDVFNGSNLPTCDGCVTLLPVEYVDLDAHSFTAVGKRFVCRGSSEAALRATGQATVASEAALQTVGRAVELLQKQQNLEALAVIKEVLPLIPELHDLIYAKAIAELRLGMATDAVASLQLLGRRAPKHAQGIELLRMLRAQGFDC